MTQASKLTHTVIVALALAFLSQGSVVAQDPAHNNPTSKDSTASPCVMVYGAVRAPSRFELRRAVRLSEAIALAGGATDTASEEVQVVHTGTSNCAGKQNGRLSNLAWVASPPVPLIVTYRLSELVGEDEKANPYLQNGDSVLVGELPRLYVVGNVVNPQGMIYVPGMTLTKAITIAGGTIRHSNTKEIRVTRGTSRGSERTLLVVDWDSIRKHRAEDLVLEPYDVVEVPLKQGHEYPMPDYFPRFEPLPVRIVT